MSRKKRKKRIDESAKRRTATKRIDRPRLAKRIKRRSQDGAVDPGLEIETGSANGNVNVSANESVSVNANVNGSVSVKGKFD